MKILIGLDNNSRIVSSQTFGEANDNLFDITDIFNEYNYDELSMHGALYDRDNHRITFDDVYFEKSRERINEKSRYEAEIAEILAAEGIEAPAEEAPSEEAPSEEAPSEEAPSEEAPE